MTLYIFAASGAQSHLSIVSFVTLFLDNVRLQTTCFVYKSVLLSLSFYLLLPDK